MTKLFIIGAGGHGRVVADCAESMACFSEIVFLDDSYPERTNNLHWPIVGQTKQWQSFQGDGVFVIAIGDNHARLALFEKMNEQGCQFTNIIHPSAVISAHVNLGQANVIFANAAINAGSHLGNANIINTGATVDHDCQLAHGIHISPGVNIAGTVTIEKLCWLGIGASVIQGLHLKENTQLGAGAVLISNSSANTLSVGVPAKVIKSI
ncbi:acetyltransferase [Thalassotalea ganghwensis]